MLYFNRSIFEIMPTIHFPWVYFLYALPTFSLHFLTAFVLESLKKKDYWTVKINVLYKYEMSFELKVDKNGQRTRFTTKLLRVFSLRSVQSINHENIPESQTVYYLQFQVY